MQRRASQVLKVTSFGGSLISLIVSGLMLGVQTRITTVAPMWFRVCTCLSRLHASADVLTCIHDGVTAS